LERHVEQAMTVRREAKTVFVERQLRADFGEFALIGRIDRLDEYPDGTLEVVDYKSGRQEVEAIEVESDIAMSVYQLLVRRNYPDRPVRATIIALRSGTEASAMLSDEAIAALEADLRELGQQILNRNYEELVPVRKALCERCDFLPLCRKHAEFGE
jgi:RecB family exonuclease